MSFVPLTYAPLPEQTAEAGAARFRPGKRGWFIAPAEGAGKSAHDIAEVHCSASLDRKQQEAWARLFVASPALLASLKAIVEQIGVMDTRFNDTLPAAIAAIEDATGEHYAHPCNDDAEARS